MLYDRRSWKSVSFVTQYVRSLGGPLNRYRRSKGRSKGEGNIAAVIKHHAMEMYGGMEV
jgi:hypothetical protein